MNTNDPIKTSQVLPGIWHATFGEFDLGDAIGTGSTEAEAVSDLYQWAGVEIPANYDRKTAVFDLMEHVGPIE